MKTKRTEYNFRKKPGKSLKETGKIMKMKRTEYNFRKKPGNSL